MLLGPRDAASLLGKCPPGFLKGAGEGAEELQKNDGGRAGRESACAWVMTSARSPVALFQKSVGIMIFFNLLASTFKAQGLSGPGVGAEVPSSEDLRVSQLGFTEDPPSLLSSFQQSGGFETGMDATC